MVAMKFRDCIRFLVMLAFVLTTAPTVGHAAMASEAPVKSVKTEAQPVKGDHDCCPKGKKDRSEDIASGKGKTHSDKNDCCDKNGKCVSNSCTNTAKVSSLDSSYVYSPMAAKTRFSLAQEGAATGLSNRIKRPPRA